MARPASHFVHRVEFPGESSNVAQHLVSIFETIARTSIAGIAHRTMPPSPECGAIPNIPMSMSVKHHCVGVVATLPSGQSFDDSELIRFGKTPGVFDGISSLGDQIGK